MRLTCGCAADPCDSDDYCLVHRGFYCHRVGFDADDPNAPVSCPPCRRKQESA